MVEIVDRITMHTSIAGLIKLMLYEFTNINSHKMV